jgi:hypothetical protein
MVIIMTGILDTDHRIRLKAHSVSKTRDTRECKRSTEKLDN